MHQNMQSGDTGTAIIITLEDEDGFIDISDATFLEMVFEKPDRTPFGAYEAEFYTDGSDGKLQYISSEDEFVLPGKWQVQAHIVTPAGEWWSSVNPFWVKENLTLPPEP